MTAAVRVLVVDDDPTVSDVVRGYLVRAGIGVELAADGVTALAVAGRTRPDLVVLDLMLPGLSGLEVCARLREQRPDLPIVMLTALGEESDRILGLEQGADDYLVKPFSPRELVLRVQSVLRRSGAVPTGDQLPRRLVSGGLVVDVPGRTVTLEGRPVTLTGREFDLLAHFMAHPGRAFDREQLMRQVWGWDFGDTSTVTVHVRRLREKVEEDPATPHRLVTVWGVGYRWQDPADQNGLPSEAARAFTEGPAG
jgi:DNA-binding response OmpR family regulator